MNTCKLIDIGLSEFTIFKNLVNIRRDYIGQLSDLDILFLYSLVRYYRPVKILEVGCSYGFSTKVILEALYQNKLNFSLNSYDVDFEKIKILSEYLKTESRVSISCKDLFDIDFESYDFIFMDSDHTSQAANFYLNSLISNEIPFSLAVHDVHELTINSQGTEAIILRDFISSNDFANEYYYKYNQNIISSLKKFNITSDFQSKLCFIRISRNYEALK